jgi:hypothetical protein
MTDRREELRRRSDEITREMGDHGIGTRKELNALPEILDADESLISFASGFLDGNTWLIVLTDKRVIFLDKGMFFGMKQISIDLSKINAVQNSSGLIFGGIVIGDGARSYEITNISKKSASGFSDKVRSAMSARQSGGTGTVDRVAQLERLAALRTSGALDEREFQAEKAKLIG